MGNSNLEYKAKTFARVKTVEMDKQLDTASPVYEAIHGINYGEADTRIEPGEVVPADLIQSSPWLLANGHVRPRKGGK